MLKQYAIFFQKDAFNENILNIFVMCIQLIHLRYQFIKKYNM